MRRLLHACFALAVALTTSGGAWLEAGPRAPMGQMDCCPCAPQSAPSPDCCPPAGPVGCPLRLPTSAPAIVASSLRTSPARRADRREPRPRPGWHRSGVHHPRRPQIEGQRENPAPPSSPPKRQALLSVFRI
ncbi:MAG TPA: hypothetical protein VJ600_04520 [Holophagaceae bacterium]|nr:hypothetical protein [Holophagaceae bacterium]